jgi:hypothetical protein
MAVVLPLVAGFSGVNAQNKTEVSVGADLVSSYIWRGQDCGGVSIQPTISVGRSGFSLTAWGSVGFDKNDTKEVDLTLGYSTGGFSAGVTDYWFNSAPRYFDYAAHGAHLFEGTLAYDFGVVAVAWNTNFAGNDYFNADGKRSFSSYAEVSVPFNLGGLDFSAEVGMTPWEGMYADKLNVVNISLGVQKVIQVTPSFAVPAFAKLTANPYQDKMYFAFGLSF